MNNPTLPHERNGRPTKVIAKGNIDRAMTSLCNVVEQLEMEFKNTRNLFADIEPRQADLRSEVEQTENVSQILNSSKPQISI